METLLKPTLFWDCDLKQLDLSKNARFIIERVLAYGEVADFVWIKKTYGLEKIKEVFLHNRTLDKRSQSFWCLYFNIPCTQNLLNKKADIRFSW